MSALPNVTVRQSRVSPQHAASRLLFGLPQGSRFTQRARGLWSCWRTVSSATGSVRCQRMWCSRGMWITCPPAPAKTRSDGVVAIVHEDEDCCVVDKPPQLVAHVSCAFAQHMFIHERQEKLSTANTPWVRKPVHRLFRETSGLLLLGKSKAATRRAAATV
ncbi:MAG: hypothetical protein NT107_06235 [Planctomycetota bacterium]|nr:hypothetical protein [Planctomycetota bacterium]